jgi:ribosomal protein S12 methylthiotransferase
VLIEGQGITDDGQTLVVGRSFREAPGIDGQLLLWGDAPIGTRVQAHIIDATPYDLWGELNQCPAVVE